MLTLDSRVADRYDFALFEICFDGRREAVWAEPWVPSGPAGALVAVQRASQQLPPPDRAFGLKIVFFVELRFVLLIMISTFRKIHSATENLFSEKVASRIS